MPGCPNVNPLPVVLRHPLLLFLTSRHSGKPLQKGATLSAQNASNQGEPCAEHKTKHEELAQAAPRPRRNGGQGGLRLRPLHQQELLGGLVQRRGLTWGKDRAGKVCAAARHAPVKQPACRHSLPSACPAPERHSLVQQPAAKHAPVALFQKYIRPDAASFTSSQRWAGASGVSWMTTTALPGSGLAGPRGGTLRAPVDSNRRAPCLHACWRAEAAMIPSTQNINNSTTRIPSAFDGKGRGTARSLCLRFSWGDL